MIIQHILSICLSKFRIFLSFLSFAMVLSEISQNFSLFCAKKIPIYPLVSFATLCYDGIIISFA